MRSAFGRNSITKRCSAGSIPDRQSMRQKLGGAATDRKTEITIETYEVLIMKSHVGLRRRWCAGCGKQVALVSLNDACSSGFNLQNIQQQVVAGRITRSRRLAGRDLPHLIDSNLKGDKHEENVFEGDFRRSSSDHSVGGCGPDSGVGARKGKKDRRNLAYIGNGC